MKPNPSFPDSDDSPEFTLEDMKKARLRVGLKDVSLEEWQASVRKRLNESVNLNITLEPDIAAWFKRRAEVIEFNGLINSILREAIHSKELEEALRKLTHEELQQI
ncbi:MAG: BrnA antitoxin family protein [Candidatus Methylumidiphilus sp.]